MQTTASSRRGKGWSLRTRLMLVSAAAIVAVMAVTAISLLVARDYGIRGTLHRSLQASAEALDGVNILRADLNQMRAEAEALVGETDRSRQDSLASSMRYLAGGIDGRFGILQGLVQRPDRKEALVKINAAWGECKKELSGGASAVQGGQAGGQAPPQRALRTKRFADLNSSLFLFANHLREDIKADQQDVGEQMRKALFGLVIAALCLIIVLAALFHMVANSIVRPIEACADFATKVVQGKYYEHLEHVEGVETGRLASAMNTLVETLEGMFSRSAAVSGGLAAIDSGVAKTSKQVAESGKQQQAALDETKAAAGHLDQTSREMAEGLDRLSASASETSSSILEMAASIEEVAISADKLGGTVDEVSSSVVEMAASIKEIGNSIVNLLDTSSTTASSIAEMDATIKQVEKNAMDTAAISEGVKKDAATGKKAVEEAIAGMHAIRSSSRITAEVVETLSLRANDIGAILSVIDEVAEQTNLLALNAAIIAAQAGEHGKGFAVVADEIRELAERTSSSTREIATVIQGVQDETRRAVDAINLAEGSITEGEKLSQRSGLALEKIVSGVERASIQIREIARATVEQARGSQSIKEAMESVAEMIGRIAGSAGEHATASELLTVAVERMKDLTIHVRISVREQSRASNLIANSTEDINQMIGQLRDTCRTQGGDNRLIATAVEHICATSAANMQAIQALEQTVGDLSRQISLLEKENKALGT